MLALGTTPGAWLPPPREGMLRLVQREHQRLTGQRPVHHSLGAAPGANAGLLMPPVSSGLPVVWGQAGASPHLPPSPHLVAEHTFDAVAAAREATRTLTLTPTLAPTPSLTLTPTLTPTLTRCCLPPDVDDAVRLLEYHPLTTKSPLGSGWG